jgi:orotate phosphoribosyltransferase
MMNPEKVLELFKERGALLEGHFKLTSGMHSDSYLQCALVLQYACDADRLGAELARRFKDPSREKPITTVVTPAIGGIVLGYAIARPLGARAIFAERVNQHLELRRGFTLVPGENVLVAEDVLTTGGSVRELISLAEAAGAQVVGVAALADRGVTDIKLPAPKQSLLRLPLVTYAADSCPLCEQGIPLVKPGSRPETTAQSSGLQAGLPRAGSQGSGANH